ncbi:MAG: Hsp20/alpha crystallin family protein [Eubacteriales bacterium]|nr:Hsp20/alpha crystallin family protein [Eubacteriales bacterium]
MMMPSIFGENLFDDFFDDDFMNENWMMPFNEKFFGKKNPLYGKNAARMMKTDVKELDSGYEVDIDLPGFKKDEVKAELNDGYLTISAAKGLDKDQKDKEGRYIRKERYAGSMSRSFYVGENVKQEDIHARFENGILRLSIPKNENKKLESKAQIAIEG